MRYISEISTDIRHFRPRPTHWSYIQHGTTSNNVGDSSAMLGVVENVQYPLKSRSYLIPFLDYYQFRFIGRHFYFRLSAECRPTSNNIGYSSSVLDVVENVQYPLKSRRYLIPFLRYYYFRFICRHCYFPLSAECLPTSDNVPDSSSVLGVVEIVQYPLKYR